MFLGDVAVDADWITDVFVGVEDDELHGGNGEIIELDGHDEDCAPKRVAIDPGAPSPQEIEDIVSTTCHFAAGASGA